MPIAPGIPVWPDERRSGDPVVDRVLDAVIRGDGRALEGAVDYADAPCVAFMFVTGRPPVCREGEAVGTPGRYFFTGGTEGSYFREGEPLPLELLSQVISWSPRQVAVHDRPSIPGARLAAVVAFTVGPADVARGDCLGAVELLIGDVGLVGISGGCEPRSRLLPDGASYLVPPPSETPR